MPLTYKELILIGGVFLILKDIPIGDYIKLAGTACGL
jgi:hypothetical protein